jgi:sulfide dehydrogenase cytochrome subunit
MIANKITKYVILFASGILINPTTWATEINTPPLIVGTCITCHGAGGSSVGPANPTIAGLKSKTFIDIMEEYRDEKRPSTIMGRIAKGYTAENFKVMADYFAKQLIRRYSQQVDAKKVKAGGKHHKKYCEKCHANNGYTESEEGSSILAGQRMPYLQFSLADYYTGAREMPKKMKKRMVKMIKEHGKESLDELVHFYGSYGSYGSQIKSGESDK